MTNMPMPDFSAMVAARHDAFPVDAAIAATDPAWIAFDVANTRVVRSRSDADLPADDPRRIGTFAGADGVIWAIIHAPLPR